jgi:cytochrome P450
MMLAMHKEVQEKAFEEAKTVIEGLRGPMTLDDVSKLPYIEMVIKESMRLFPAESVIGRETSGDVHLGLKVKLNLNF